jgi:hypothetical protein
MCLGHAFEAFVLILAYLVYVYLHALLDYWPWFFFNYQLNCYNFLSRNFCGHFLFLFFSSFHPYLLTGKIILPICLVGLQLVLVALFIFFLLWLTHFLIPMSRDLCIIPLYAFTAEPAYLKGPSYAIYFDGSFIYVLLPYVLLPE